MNNKNLTRAGKEIDSTAKAQKLGKMGGIASGEAKRRNKSMKDLAKEMLKMTPIDEVKDILLKACPGISEEDATNSAALIQAQIAKAFEGDTRAAEFVRDTAGQKPIDQYEDISGEVVVDVDGKPE